MSILSDDIVPDWLVYQHSEQFTADILHVLRKCKNRICKLLYIVPDQANLGYACVDHMTVVIDWKSSENGYDIELDYEKAAKETHERLLQRYPDQPISLQPY